jgi:hypothetical protein
MKHLVILMLVIILGSILAACGSALDPVISNSPTATKSPSSDQPAEQAAVTPPSAQPTQTLPSTQPAAQDLTRSDSQGAITIEVKPKNLSNPSDTLDFEISLTTHSVDLSMDLAALSTLTTDDGRTVQAILWDAPRGGHHVSGTLSFPTGINGEELLAGAKTLTLTIKDVDAPCENSPGIWRINPDDKICAWTGISHLDCD